MWKTLFPSRRKTLRPCDSPCVNQARPSQEFRLAEVVVLDRRHRFVVGDVEVVVEIAARRRVPREAPAHAPLVRRELRERRARDDRERRVARVQVREVAEVVGHQRAARAALVPRRVEHEVVHDELAAPVEEIEQGRLAGRAVEPVGLVDPHHRQPPAFRVHRVAVTRQFLLLRQQRLAGGQPLIARHRSRQRRIGQRHHDCPFRRSSGRLSSVRHVAGSGPDSGPAT